MRTHFPGVVAGAAIAALATIPLVGLPAAAASSAGLSGGASPAAGYATAADCHNPAPGHAHCQAYLWHAAPGARSAGVGAADIKAAYDLPSGGSGQTVYIVDAGGYDSMASDLATFRSNNNLPACDTSNGCFTTLKQDGTPGQEPNAGDNWPLEEALDLDAVSSVCPACHIVMVEGATSADADMYGAEQTALDKGAKFISNSWTGDAPDASKETTLFNKSGVLFAFATGDSGESNPGNYPAASQYTLAVGGTTLSGSGSSWSESAWNGAGSGCSSVGSEPEWQKAVSSITSACNGKKANSDVAADADPGSGLNIVLNGGSQQVGGTSLATPLVTAMYALAGTPNAGDDPASYPYAHTAQLTDVTSGSNGGCGAPLCQAGTGWDGPTGLGTPLGKGVAAFTPGTPSTQVTVTNPGDQTSTTSDKVSLQLRASGGTPPYTWAAKGLPAGLTLDTSSGLITGTPTTVGTYKVAVSAGDTAKAGGSADFTWNVTAPQALSLVNPGDQTGTQSKAASLQLQASGGSKPYTYAATGLPDGLTIDSASGLISGTPTTASTYAVTATVTDASGAAQSAKFAWTVQPYTSPLSASFAVDSDFGQTVFAHFTLTNASSSQVSSWTLGFDLASNESCTLANPGQVGTQGSRTTITGTFPVPAGGSLDVTVFFQVNSGAFSAPTNIAVAGS